MALVLKTADASAGPRWVREAFQLFSKKPLHFTALFVVFLFAALLMALLPGLGAVLQMMVVPLLSLGFMIASRSALEGGPVMPGQFIEPLKSDPARRRTLLKLCAIYGVAALVIFMLADHVSDNAWARLQKLMAEGDSAQAQIDALLAEPGVGTAVLLALVLGTALSIPFWHAPALVHWGGQSLGQALFSSTLAVWRNKGAFVTYLLTWAGAVLGFVVVTALLFGLLGAPQLAGLMGLPAGLIFSAVFYVSLVFTFNDSFGVAEEPPAPPDAAAAV